MKKTLLLGAIALMATTAMAQVSVPTLTPGWTIDQNLPVTGDGRWGAAFGDKFYINEKGVGLHSFAGTDGAKSTIEGVVSAGTAFNFDGAGNAMLSNGWAGAGAMKNFVLWNAETGETTNLSIETILGEIGYTAARMDYMGRGVGNIFSEEGGAFFLASATADYILKVYIKNGELDTEKTKVISGPATGDSGTIVVPLTNDPNSDEVLHRYRTNRNFYYNNGIIWVAQETVGSVSQTAGGDIVSLGGVLFTIEPAGTNYFDGWQIVERTTNTVVASVPEGAGSKCGHYLTVLSAEKVSDTKANIYHYHNGEYLKKYTFEIPEGYFDALTAIEEVGADNAAVEYYNLQGVKVANPENGIFIKKQGTKTTKVVL